MFMWWEDEEEGKPKSASDSEETTPDEDSESSAGEDLDPTALGDLMNPLAMFSKMDDFLQKFKDELVSEVSESVFNRLVKHKDEKEKTENGE